MKSEWQNNITRNSHKIMVGEVNSSESYRVCLFFNSMGTEEKRSNLGHDFVLNIERWYDCVRFVGICMSDLSQHY